MKTKKKSRPYIIGIAGGTGSGKTLLAQKLAEINPNKVLVVGHDNYYKTHVDGQNFDYPGAVDNKLLVRHLKDLIAGKSIKVPVYDFEKKRRTRKTIRMRSKPVIILEGIFALESEEIRKFFDLKIYLDIDADIRLGYRLIRDVEERGYTLRGAIEYYSKTVHVMHNKWVEPTKQFADLIVSNNEGDFRVATDVLGAKVRQEAKKS